MYSNIYMYVYAYFKLVCIHICKCMVVRVCLVILENCAVQYYIYMYMCFHSPVYYFSL